MQGWGPLQALSGEDGKKLEGGLYGGMTGTVLASQDGAGLGAGLASPVRGLPALTNNRVICVRYRDPAFSQGHLFPAKRLAGATDPPCVLRPGDMAGGGGGGYSVPLYVSKSAYDLAYKN